MDKKQLRKLAGLPEGIEEKLEESAISTSREKEGPIVTLSLGPYPSNVRRVARFSSFKVQVDKPTSKEKSTDDNFRELDKADRKIADQKLKEVVKLSKKFQADVKKILEK